MSSPPIVIVNDKDEVVGSASIAEARTKGLIHRIIRIFVFNSKGELLLQQRSANLDFPLLWDQSVGGHVDAGESYLEAAVREAAEEISLKGAGLQYIQTYYTEVTNPDGGSEPLRRFNALYSALSDAEPTADPEEVEQLKWLDFDEVGRWMAREPEVFTGGFIHAYQVYKDSQIS